MTTIGIDLGTTNSVVAHSKQAEKSASILINSDGERFTPSVVSFRAAKGDARADEYLVGRTAVNHAEIAPEQTVRSVKRIMGRDFDDEMVVRLKGECSYRIVPGEGGDARAYVELGGQLHSPAQVSSMILRKLARDAEKRLPEKPDGVIITVPAYFNEHQRSETRRAGELAGMQVKRVIDEPTAAAIAFGVDPQADERHTILVYDLGGGTFDISILQMARDPQGRELFEALKIAGDTWLGGDDFDAKIVDAIEDHVRESCGEDPAHDRRFLVLAHRAAEQAKRTLGQSEIADIIIPHAYTSSGGKPVDVEMVVTRGEFEEWVRPLVNRSTDLVDKALRDAGLKTEHISDVLLVGGSTLVPLVHESVERIFPGRVRGHVDAMNCVAMGAAILAATMRGVECPNCQAENDEEGELCTDCGASLSSARSVGAITVGDITERSLGIRAVSGDNSDAFSVIIPRDTPYPLAEPITRTFGATSGRLIRVPVYVGEHEVATENEEVGVVEFELPEEVEATTKVDVTFNYDKDRVTTVTVQVQGTALARTEVLERDRPRARRSGRDSSAEPDWRAELESIIEFMTRFLEHYRPFIEGAHVERIARDLEKAMGAGDPMEAKQLTRVLHLHVMNSGLASDLYLAERATDGAPPNVADQINQNARRLREAHLAGRSEEAGELARLLKPLVAKTLEAVHGVQAVEDRENLMGLLRELGRR